MKVKLTRDYPCAPEGHTTFFYKEGDIVDGRAADLAIRDKAGAQVRADAGEKRTPKKKTPKPQETKPAQPDHEG